MVKIRVLDEVTINQMAAGEVIENPASIVKELLDNSLDAYATEIVVEVVGGGRQLIRVVDNGCGMSQDDALLSLERHATSKILKTNDLNSIASMGFRGEALPSIASVSKVTLLTNDKEEGDGTLLIVNGGTSIQCKGAACSKGTMIEVKSLFFNLPVRKKFQRSTGYDFQKICKVLNETALAYPHVHFKLISDQRQVYSYAECKMDTLMDSLAARVHDVLGGEFLSQTLPIEYEGDLFSLKGFFGLPSYTRPNRTGFYFLVNKRPIQSFNLSKAILKAYGTHLSPRRFPVFASFWEINPEFIDVNVHPQKREIRFRQFSKWEEECVGAIQSGLMKRGLAPPSVDFHFPESNNTTKLNIKDLGAVSLYQRSGSQGEHQGNSPSYSVDLPFKEEEREGGRLEGLVKVIGTSEEYIFVTPDSFPLKVWDVIGKKCAGGVCVIDQLAVQERVIFDHISSDLQEQPAEIQHLLISHPFDVTSVEASLLRGHLDVLLNMGIGIKEVEGEGFFIQSHPVYLLLEELEKVVRDCLNEDLMEASFGEEVARRVSQQTAQMKRKALSTEQAQLLVKKWLQGTHWIASPQGKPTLCYLDQRDIEQLFIKGNQWSFNNV